MAAQEVRHRRTNPDQIAAVSDLRPVLIVGQGLAGTAVAWRLWERQVPFLIVDPQAAQTSSKVAAGLVTPITGMRLNLSWRMAALAPEAVGFYESIEHRLGRKFYHATPHVRLFKNDRELKIWETRSTAPELQPWLESPPPTPLVDEASFHGERGGFQQRDSGWLDTASYLEASRTFFAAEQRVQTGEVNDQDLAVTATGVTWQGVDFSHVVFCRGWQESGPSRFFPWLEFDAARGVIVTLRADVAEHRILNRGAWMLRRPDGAWRAGSTYEFDFNRPIEDSVAEVRRKLEGLLKAPYEITAAQAGIRPIIKRLPAVVGRHPSHERVCVLNGLGSKGVLRSPSMARLLVEHLLDGRELDTEVDVRSHP